MDEYLGFKAGDLVTDTSFIGYRHITFEVVKLASLRASRAPLIDLPVLVCRSVSNFAMWGVQIDSRNILPEHARRVIPIIAMDADHAA